MTRLLVYGTICTLLALLLSLVTLANGRYGIVLVPAACLNTIAMVLAVRLVRSPQPWQLRLIAAALLAIDGWIYIEVLGRLLAS